MRGASDRRRRLALYWAAACGGCDIAVLETGEFLLSQLEAVEIVFWPCLLDVKLDDVRALPDGFIDLCLFHGAIRTEHDVALARLLRAKSATLVAFGSCAVEGCVPALANLTTREDVLRTAFADGPTTPNPGGVVPQASSPTPWGPLELPRLRRRVATLDSVVDVDHTVPGCPPTAETVARALERLLGEEPLPPGSVLGAGDACVCEECRFVRRGGALGRFVRPHLQRPAAGDDRCLLEQGFLCLGPATRSGCGAQCPDANLGCRGCYGPTGGSEDVGAAMAACLGARVAGESAPGAIEDWVGQIVDPTGTLYRFGLGKALLTPVAGTSRGEER